MHDGVIGQDISAEAHISELVSFFKCPSMSTMYVVCCPIMSTIDCCATWCFDHIVWADRFYTNVIAN